MALTHERWPQGAWSSLSEVASTEHSDKGFNSEYVGADGKIDKGRLFGYILQNGKQMSLAQLRQVVMIVANVKSFNFAFRLIEEARLQGLLKLVQFEGKDYYKLGP